MTRHRRLPLALMAALILAGCAQPPLSSSSQQVRASVAVPVRKAAPSSAPLESNVLPARLVERMTSLDVRVYRAVAVAEAQGRVLLVGAVARPDQRHSLESALQTVPGVVQVFDRIQVADDSVIDQYRPDTEKEAELARSYALPGIAMRVVKGVVYLVGATNTPRPVDDLRDGIAADPALKWIDATAVQVGADP